MTPPVALAAYASSGIAHSDPVKTGIKAFQLSLAGFIVPYLFVYHPSLIFINTNGINTAIIFITTMLGIISLAAVVTGYLFKEITLFERFIFLVASLLLIYPGWLTDLVGGVVLIILLTVLKQKSSSDFSFEAEA